MEVEVRQHTPPGHHGSSPRSGWTGPSASAFRPGDAASTSLIGKGGVSQRAQTLPNTVNVHGAGDGPEVVPIAGGGLAATLSLEEVFLDDIPESCRPNPLALFNLPLPTGCGRGSPLVGSADGAVSCVEVDLTAQPKRIASTSTPAPYIIAPPRPRRQNSRRLSAVAIQELTDPDSLPIGPAPDRAVDHPTSTAVSPALSDRLRLRFNRRASTGRSDLDGDLLASNERTLPVSRHSSVADPLPVVPPPPPSLDHRPVVLSSEGARPQHYEQLLPSPQSGGLPLPPMSLPLHLGLELAAQRPSPLYIYHSPSSELPYESMAVKFDRLKNFLLLPPYLERTLAFGTLACFDAWLYTFTILPIRFVIALTILASWLGRAVRREAAWNLAFVWHGLGRLWTRILRRGGRWSSRLRLGGLFHTPNRSQSRSESLSGACAAPLAVSSPGGAHMPVAIRSAPNTSRPFSAEATNGNPCRRPLTATEPAGVAGVAGVARVARAAASSSIESVAERQHMRTKNARVGGSRLSLQHKADLVQGAIILCTSLALMKLDASRMYHLIRAQSAIKLYVIYNVLEVGDRLLSALGQDILECLLSAETLSYDKQSEGQIRTWTRTWTKEMLVRVGMFGLGLGYCILHSVALYYQVMALNVAVNSYSNALLTLLLSNQFVEVKSTVFKRIEKDNLFQLTCADVVERFQLWVMLLIVGLRNLVEVGALSVSVPGPGLDTLWSSLAGSSLFSASSIPPSLSSASTFSSPGSEPVPMHSPFILPHSFTVLPSWLWSGEVLSPFVIVIASEVLVDSIKHCYVTRFNNIKPAFYSRILDILSKDYYTTAFTTPSLTRRLGLPVIPLSCLFIRSSVQTYHMYLSAHLAAPSTTQTSALVETATDGGTATWAMWATWTTLATWPVDIVRAGLERVDGLVREALGGWVYGRGPGLGRGWAGDDVVVVVAMVVGFSAAFALLLLLKLGLGMVLLRYARGRYVHMKRRDADGVRFEAPDGRRVGPRGQVEVSDEQRRCLHADASEGLAKLAKTPAAGGTGPGLYTGDGVARFAMVAKRIW